MIRITNTIVVGFQPALHGMRNPMESWEKSNSTFYAESPVINWKDQLVPENPVLGDNDIDLMCRLIFSGSEHAKFMRDICIWVQIEPNRGCWQELDTYKVSTVRNSCSTMHKLGSRPLTYDDFQDGIVMDSVLDKLNALGAKYRETKDYSLVIEMKRILPEGFLQMANYHMNYANALNMFNQRRNHRLPEWRFTGSVNPLPDGRMSICDWIYSLPYMDYIIKDQKSRQEARIEEYREEGRKEVRAALQVELDKLQKALHGVLGDVKLA